MELIHVNPPALHTSPAFSQGVLVRGDFDLLQVGGQNGTDASGAIVPGGIGPQTEQAMRNVLAVLEAAGADQTNVIRMSILLVEGHSFEEGFAAAMLGHFDVVKAAITADPRAAKAPGPHGIPLMMHVKMGGEPARPVLEYLQSLG